MRPHLRALALIFCVAPVLAAGARPAAALAYLNVTVQPDRAVPVACLSFSTELPPGRAQGLES